MKAPLSKTIQISGLTRALAVVACTVSLSLASVAQGAKYPLWAQSASDLRDARSFLDSKSTKMDVRQEDEKAVRQIDAALTDMKGAGVPEGRGAGPAPAEDANLDRVGRYSKVTSLLARAHQDLSGAREVDGAPGLKQRVLKEIETAQGTVQDSMGRLKTGK